MSGITHRFIKTNGINMHIAEAGSGPVVLLLHGFPDFWFTWRYQIPALANAGFHAVAPDIRGFGQTDAPAAEKYTVFDITGDLIGLIDELGEKQVFVVGHDWGAEAAWALALFRPDRVRAVVTLSVPYTPRQNKGSLLSIVAPRLGEGWYMAQFQKPGHAEAEIARVGLLTFLRETILSSKTSPLVVPKGKSLADVFEGSSPLTSWFTAEDLDQYVQAFKTSGLTGPINVYRAIQRRLLETCLRFPRSIDNMETSGPIYEGQYHYTSILHSGRQGHCLACSWDQGICGRWGVEAFCPKSQKSCGSGKWTLHSTRKA